MDGLNLSVARWCNDWNRQRALERDRGVRLSNPASVDFLLTPQRTSGRLRFPYGVDHARRKMKIVKNKKPSPQFDDAGRVSE